MPWSRRVPWSRRPPVTAASRGEQGTERRGLCRNSGALQKFREVERWSPQVPGTMADPRPFSQRGAVNSTRLDVPSQRGRQNPTAQPEVWIAARCVGVRPQSGSAQTSPVAPGERQRRRHAGTVPAAWAVRLRTDPRTGEGQHDVGTRGTAPAAARPKGGLAILSA